MIKFISYTSPLHQDQLFPLIHGNKHRESNKMGEERNMFQMMEQGKMSERTSGNEGK